MFLLSLFYFDCHIVPVAEGGVWLAVTQGGEGGDMHPQGLGVADQPITLEVGVHLDLQNEMNIYYLNFLLNLPVAPLAWS